MKTCLNCGKIISQRLDFSHLFKFQHDLLCEDCFKGLESVQKGCLHCGKKTNEDICSDCIYWMQLEETKSINLINYSMYYYNDIAKNMIDKVKFLGDVKLLRVFKHEVKRFIKNKYFKNMFIVPVPLHEKRLLERGFNQSLEIAKLLPFPILDVVCKSNNEKQSKKTRAERICFDQQFSLKENVNLRNRSVLIVDDIYTTGATVHKIAKLLMSRNVQKIVSFTLFRS